MSQSATHIIARQSYRFRVPAVVDTGELQRLCNEDLPSRLNELFDRVCGPETVLRIKNLDVKLALDPADFSTRTLGQKLEIVVRQALQEHLKNVDVPVETAATLNVDALLFYLQHGFLPWWANSDETESLSERLKSLGRADLQRFQAEFAALAKRSPGAISRLAELLSKIEIDALTLQRWSDFPTPLSDALLTFLQGIQSKNGPQTSTELLSRNAALALVSAFLNRSLKEESRLSIFLKAILESSSFLKEIGLADFLENLAKRSPEQTAELKKISAALKTLAQGSLQIPDVSTENGRGDSNSHAEQNSSPENRIRISNAGLVLIAPYLGRFFESCGIVENDVLTNPAKAIALLRFCVFKNTDCLENERVLEKILTGMEPAESPGLLPTISEEEMTECDAMLSAVIANWPVLKQTSPDGLRQSFLQREGLLERKDNGWQLRVQLQSHDILLDYIPWSFSIVRTPWMKDLLFVDWSN